MTRKVDFCYASQRRNLFVNEKGLLFRKSGEHQQLVLPFSMRNLIYKHLHMEMGHLSPEKVVDLAKKRVYWPKIEFDISNFIQKK